MEESIFIGIDVDSGSRCYVVGKPHTVKSKDKDGNIREQTLFDDAKYFSDVKSCVESVMKNYQRNAIGTKNKELSAYLMEIKEIHHTFNHVLNEIGNNETLK